MSSPKAIIGRVELVDLPEFNLNNLEAKVDTGADSSSLHCTNIQTHADGTVSFFVLDSKHKNYLGIECRLPLYAKKIVKSSNGLAKERAFIRTTIHIGGQNHPIILSLTNRTKMSKPMLLGKRFLAGRFLVDVSLMHTLNKNKKEKKQ